MEDQQIERLEAELTLPLEELLVDTTLNNGRIVSNKVQNIGLGGFSDSIDLLRNATYTQPSDSRMEHGVAVYLSAQGELIIPETPSVGSENRFHVKPDIKVKSLDPRLSKRERQDKLLVAVPHTHPSNRPPSDLDLQELLIDGENPTASTTSIVVTQDKTYLVFRSPDTPSLGWKTAYEEMGKYYSEWIALRKRNYERIKNNGGDYHSYNNQTSAAFCQSVVDTYRLVMFIHDTRGNTARRATVI